MTQDETRREQVPPHETSASPVQVSVAMPHYFGLTPPTLLFGIATAALALAVVLAVVGHWVAALALAVVALLSALMFLGGARRKPDTAVARASARASHNARDRAVWLLETFKVRSAAARDVTSMRHELLALEGRRESLFRALGVAVYEENEAETKAVKDELSTVHAEIEDRERRIEEVASEARERLEQGRRHVQPTVIRKPGDEE
jgi:hypothetical protein